MVSAQSAMRMNNRTAVLVLSFAAFISPGCMSGHDYMSGHDVALAALPVPEPANSPRVLYEPGVYQPKQGELIAGEWTGGIGLGFTLDPDSFLTSLNADYALDENYSVGPLIQFGNSDDDTIFTASAQIKRYIDLDDSETVRPYAQVGAGIAFLDKDEDGGRTRDGLGFLFNVGIGADFPIDDNISLGTSILFNILPAKVAGENFFFSWQVLSVKISF